MKVICVILLFLLQHNIKAQTNIEEIKQYYNSVNLQKVIKNFELKYNKDRDSVEKEVGISFDRFNFNTSNPVLIIEVLLNNEVKKYQNGESLLNYLRIDSGSFRLLYLNRRNLIEHYIYSLPNNGVAVLDKKSFDKNFRKSYKRIMRKEPSVIMVSQSINYITPSFLYIKDSKIYIYVINKGKSYELNNYVNNHFTYNQLKEISDLYDCFKDPDCVIVE